MKSHVFFCTLLAAPLAVCSAAQGAESADLVTSVLPTDGTLKQGAVVRVVPSEEFATLQKNVLARFAKLPKEKQQAISDRAVEMTLAEYTPELWPNKADYDAYAAAWKKATLIKAADVAIGLRKNSDGTYHVISATRISNSDTMPITMGSLSYDATKHVWLSNNGEMTGKEFQTNENHLLGAQTGMEWSLTKEDSLSILKEQVRVTKATDGKGAYIYYNLSEISAYSKAPIANHGYVIFLPHTAAAANTGRPGQK